MIKTEQAYLHAKKIIKEFEDTYEEKKQQLQAEGWTDEQIDLGLSPSEHMIENLKREVKEYGDIKQGLFDKTITFSNIGIRLIQFRIFKKVSQSVLAKRLGVTPALISRDERNNYSGITFDKAKRILNALGIDDSFSFTEPITKAQ